MLISLKVDVRSSLLFFLLWNSRRLGETSAGSRSVRSVSVLLLAETPPGLVWSERVWCNVGSAHPAALHEPERSSAALARA